MLQKLAFFLFFLISPAIALANCGTRDLIAELSADDQALLAGRTATIPFPEGSMFTAIKPGSTVTVVGTLHLPDPRLQPMLDTLQPRIEAADALILELTLEDEAALQQMAAERPDLFFLTEGPTLIDMLSEEDWALAQEQLNARGIPPFLAAKFQPWYLSLTLGLPPCVAATITSGEKGLDRQIEQIAIAAGVARSALDDQDVIFQVFGKDPLETQLEALRFGLRSDMNGDEMISTLLTAYFDGRMAQSWEFNRLLAERLDGGIWADEMEAFEQDLLVGRNEKWEPIIADIVTGKDAVIAVGALHLPGESGVLRSLERAGYTIAPF